MKRIKFFIFLIISVLFCRCEEGFEPNLSSQKAKLIAPVNNLESTERQHTFYWENMEGANSYNLIIVSPRFDSAVRLIADTTIAINNFGITLSAGDYEWKVKGKNNSTSSNFSDTWKLSIQ